MEDKEKLNNKNDNALEGNDIIDRDREAPGQQKGPKERTCWEATTDLIKSIIKAVYNSGRMVFGCIRTSAGCIFYPVKEQCQNCFKKTDMYFNPYKDATIHEI